MRNLISILTIMVIFTAPTFAYAETKNTQENYLVAKRLFEQINSLKWHYINLPKYNEVIELAKRIVDENPDTDIAIKSQYLIVQCYDKQAEYVRKDSAFDKYTKMIERRDGVDRAVQKIIETGDEYFNEQCYYCAKSYYSQVSAKYPECKNRCAYAQYKIGKCYEKMGNKEKAINEYRKIVNKYGYSDEWFR